MARTIGIGIGIPYPGAQGAGGASAAQAVRFDGINDFYEIASTGPAGVADGPDATFGFWFKMEGGDGTAQTIFEIGTTTAHRLEVVRLADNTLRVISRTSAAADIAQHVSASTFVVADGWNHALVDLNDTASIMRINGVAEGTNTPGSSGDIDLTNQYSIGHSDDPAAAELFDGCLADFWFVDESLGLTDDIAEQFYDTTLDAPRDLGTNGTGPSANVLIYLNRADPNFHLNLAGTDFVETGAVDSCTGPGNYSAQHVPAGFAPAILSDGLANTGYNYANSNTGLSDNGFFSVSMWLRRDTTAVNDSVFNTGTDKLRCVPVSSSRIALDLRNPAGTLVYNWLSNSGDFPFSNPDYVHFAMFVDLATLDDDEWYIDGSLIVKAASTFTTGETFDHTDLGMSLFGRVGLVTENWPGAISQLAVWPRKIDWGVGANMALVRGAGGEAIILPDDGNIDAGGAASFVFNKALATAHQNGGDANDWATGAGGLTSTTGPAL